MTILHGTCTHCNKTNVKLDPEYGICLFNGDECNSYMTCRYEMPDGSIIIKKVKCNQDEHGKYAAKAAAPKGYITWGILL
jgi:hypothetical protein